MPFGLTNAPATCQRFVNNTLREFLDVFCVCYLDVILLYSDNLQDHHKQVKAVLEQLHGAGLFVKAEKCEFEANKTTFLGFVISHDGIEMDPEKVSTVKNWEIPKTIQDIQCFLSFANFYRRFIEGYSRICTPLFNLLKTVDKDTDTSVVTTNPAEPLKKKTNKAPIEWTPHCQEVFNELKPRFYFAPILKQFNPALETTLETDASDYVVSGILSQRHPNPTKPDGRGTLHPVAFLSEQMSPAEWNYGIGDKELLAIIACVKRWHMYLHVVPFLIYTDHHNLQNFGTKALLNRRQARWAGLLAQYEFNIHFRPSKANGKADALTRQSGDLPKEGDNCGRPFQEILDPAKFSGFSNPVLCNTAIKHNSDIRTALAKDELAIEIAKALDTGDKQLTGQHSRSILFFFFVFYSHLTPHSPTGMAGGPIRTPTRGANYTYTKTENRNYTSQGPSPTHTPTHISTACRYTPTRYPTPTKTLSRATKKSSTLSRTNTFPPSPSTVYRHLRLSSNSSH